MLRVVEAPAARDSGDNPEVERPDAWWRSLTSSLALCALGVGVIAVADYLTGVQLSFSLFYLAPILLGARLGGRPVTIAISVLSALAWYAVDQLGGHNYDHWAIPIWNSATRLALFLSVGLLVVSLRDRVDLEHRLSRVDPLTDLLNRRAFLEVLRDEVARAPPHRSALRVGLPRPGRLQADQRPTRSRYW